MNLVPLLAAAALVSMQIGIVANAQIDTEKMDLDNNIEPNVIQTPKRHLRKYVRITSGPPKTIQHSNGPLELSCAASGFPAPNIHWLKNGQPIADFEAETNDIFSAHALSLASAVSTLIINTPSPNPEDIYTCVAISGLQKVSESSTVYNLQDEPDFMSNLIPIPVKPRIVFYYVDVLQEMGTDLVLPCRVNTYDSARIFWTDNEGNMVYGDSKMKVLASGDLLVSNLRWSDMGEYSCTVKSYYGKDTITTFVYPYKK